MQVPIIKKGDQFSAPGKRFSLTHYQDRNALPIWIQEMRRGNDDRNTHSSDPGNSPGMYSLEICKKRRAPGNKFNIRTCNPLPGELSASFFAT
jgi:hypothetical protein